MPSVRMAVTRPGKVEVDVEAMVAFMSEVGTDRSIDAMLAFCRKCLGADFVSIFTFSGTCVPALVGTATTTAADNARKAAIGYMQHFASDVNFALTSRHPAGAYLTYQTADEIGSSQYRRACYDRTGIADRFSLVCVGPARSTSVSVYRSRNSGRFSDCELERASALMPILKASLDRRDAANSAATIGTMEEIQARLKSRYPALSARELQVAARVKAGMSARRIAAELGIAETTVITHRNSVYTRIGVANLRELLLA
jgi:LuxR family transcriptional regulator, activator of tox operons